MMSPLDPAVKHPTYLHLQIIYQQVEVKELKSRVKPIPFKEKQALSTDKRMQWQTMELPKYHHK